MKSSRQPVKAPPKSDPDLQLDLDGDGLADVEDEDSDQVEIDGNGNPVLKDGSYYDKGGNLVTR